MALFFDQIIFSAFSPISIVLHCYRPILVVLHCFGVNCMWNACHVQSIPEMCQDVYNSVKHPTLVKMH